MEIIKNGVFTVPLYHGTTGLFIDSISRHGLGFIDPLIKLEAKEFMHDLFYLAEKQQWQDENWLKMRERILPTVLQENTKDDLNFKHGGSYLTYALPLGEKYAIENPFGCEYLTYLRALLGLVSSRNVAVLKTRFSNSPVLNVWEQPHDPYLVTLNHVKLEDIETEAGQDLDKHLEEIESHIAARSFGPQSFKLKKPVPKNQLSITKIGEWNKLTGELVRS